MNQTLVVDKMLLIFAWLESIGIKAISAKPRLFFHRSFFPYNTKKYQSISNIFFNGDHLDVKESFGDNTVSRIPAEGGGGGGGWVGR